jgi:hypothetical protein
MELKKLHLIYHRPKRSTPIGTSLSSSLSSSGITGGNNANGGGKAGWR